MRDKDKENDFEGLILQGKMCEVRIPPQSHRPVTRRCRCCIQNLRNSPSSRDFSILK